MGLIAKSGYVRVTGDVQLQVGMQQPEAASIAPMNSNLTAFQVSDTIDLDTLVYAVNRSEIPVTVEIKVMNANGDKIVDTPLTIGAFSLSIISVRALVTA